MARSLQLPLVDLFSADRAAAVQSIREACLDYGFFYIKNHGIDREIQLVFRESKKFFSLPFDEKMKLQRNDDHRGYTPPYAENLDPSSKSKDWQRPPFTVLPIRSFQSLLLGGNKCSGNQMEDNDMVLDIETPTKSIFDPFAPETKDLMLVPKKKNLRNSYIPLQRRLCFDDGGDLKESFYIGPAKSCKSILESNQWPSEASLPLWRATMVSYHEKILTIGKHLLSLIALSLKLDERFFETIGALDPPMGFVRLLHYPGELKVEDYDNYGASAHSDYGMITLLATDGVPGLQICRDKDRRPQLWEDVPHIEGAFIVNIGDMLERWTNCLFRSTLHRVVAIGKERYSVAFFLDPNSDCVVECLESCYSETFPPRFPPIRSGDYLKERFELTYSK